MACFRLFSRAFINTGLVKQTSYEWFYCGRSTCIGNNNLRRESMIDKKFASYEAEGKTIAIVLDKRRVETLCVKSVSPEGFKLHNGVQVVGPVIVFPYAIFSWNVRSIKDVTEESLTMFKVMEPKLDLLVFGYGKYEEFTREQRIKFHNLFKKLGLRYEALPTEQAIGTYNFLSEDFRHVACALIPPSVVDTLKLKVPLALLDKYDDDKEDEEEDEPKLLESPLKNTERKSLK